MLGVSSVEDGSNVWIADEDVFFFLVDANFRHCDVNEEDGNARERECSLTAEADIKHPTEVETIGARHSGGVGAGVIEIDSGEVGG